MAIRRRIYVSTPLNTHLTKKQIAIKERLLERIVGLNFEPQMFLQAGLPAAMGWSFASAADVARRCVGGIVLAFGRWRFTDAGEKLVFPTEYNHYEGALINALQLPILTIVERGVVDRGIAWTGGGNPILFVPEDADETWLDDASFKHRFAVWTDQLKERRDVFLAYCSQAKNVAMALHLFMTQKVGVSVIDWALDFAGGGTILEEIERAASLCSCGVFLFTKDDPLEGDAGRAAPRDNVVFEAGYFMRAKGKDRVIVIRESGAKMPADLGGNIYLHLANRNNTSAIETGLREFLEKRL